MVPSKWVAKFFELNRLLCNHYTNNDNVGLMIIRGHVQVIYFCPNTQCIYHICMYLCVCMYVGVFMYVCMYVWCKDDKQLENCANNTRLSTKQSYVITKAVFVSKMQ